MHGVVKFLLTHCSVRGKGCVALDIELCFELRGFGPIGILSILIVLGGNFLFVPLSAILVLLGVDTLMDMGRSAMNVIGNCMAAAVVARWEGELQTPALPE